MKRLVFAVAVLGLMACARGEEAQPAADSTAAAPAAAPVDSMQHDSTMVADTAKMGAAKQE